MGRNISYEEVLQQHPLGWQYNGYHNLDSCFKFEKFDAFEWLASVEANAKLSYYVAGLYIVTIFGLKSYMSSAQKGLELKWPLFFWNLGLGIFSILGFLRTTPGLIYTLQQPDGFYTSICTKRYMDMPTLFWMFLFTFSKFLELGDTIFIILRRRPLVFLQWYHHASTMIVAWAIIPSFEPVTRYFFVLNYGVHSLMYPYFALKGVGIPIPTIIANTITSLQFLQMIAGFSLNMITMYFYYTRDCMRDPMSIKMFVMLYGSFVFLFGKLFYDSVVKRGHSKKKKVD